MIYSAPKPEYNASEWFKFIALRIVFPPVLAWDLLKLGVNKLVGEFAGKITLPAQNKHFNVKKPSASPFQTHEEHIVITHDGARLDTFEIKHQTQELTRPEDQKYIINFVGNGMCYEEIIPAMQHDAEDLQANVIAFNFRGVGSSSGRAKSKDDLIIDGIAQVQRLLEKGVSPQNIVLKGHSIGGGVASLVALHFHQLGKPVNLFNSRSFSSITNVVVGQIRLKRNEKGQALNGHEESLRGKILGFLAKPFIKFVLTLAKWEINAGDAFKKIPAAYKEYIVVRTEKDKRSSKRKDDSVIPHYASIHEALTSERKAIKRDVRQLIKDAETVRAAAPISEYHLFRAKEEFSVAEKYMKSRKMTTGTGKEEANGHNIGWETLKTRDNINAHMFFTEFAQRAYQNHIKEQNKDMRL